MNSVDFCHGDRPIERRSATRCFDRLPVERQRKLLTDDVEKRCIGLSFTVVTALWQHGVANSLFSAVCRMSIYNAAVSVAWEVLWWYNMVVNDYYTGKGIHVCWYPQEF